MAQKPVFSMDVVKGPSNFFSDMGSHIDPQELEQDNVTDIDAQDATPDTIPDAVVEAAPANESGVNAFLDLDGDAPIVEDTTSTTQAPEESEKEEDEATEEVVEDTTVEEADEDDPYADHSEAALMALAFKKDGWIDDEVDKDLDYTKFKELITKKVSSIAEQAKQEALEAVEDRSKYVDFLLDGGDPAVLQQAVSYEGLVKMDLEEATNQEAVVRAGYEAQKLETTEIDALVETLKDKGQLKSKATSFQGGFKNYQESIIEQDKENRRLQREQQVKAQKENQKAVETIIRSGQIGGLSLAKPEQDKLLDALTKPTELFTYEENGKKKQVKITKVQALEHKMQNDKNMQLQYAHLLLNGFNLKEVVSDEVQNANDDLMAHLNGRTTKTTTRRKRRSANAWDDIADRAVG